MKEGDASLSLLFNFAFEGAIKESNKWQEGIEIPVYVEDGNLMAENVHGCKAKEGKKYM